AWLECRSDVEAAKRARELAHRLRELPVEIDRTGRAFVEALGSSEQGEERGWMSRGLGRLIASTRAIAEGGTRREIADRLLRLIDLLQLGKPYAGEMARALEEETRGAGSTALRAI